MGGKTALTEFRQLRKDKVSEIRIGGHDCFHDGRMALPLIRTYTKSLYNDTRNHLTQTVLDTLLGEMLSSADKRPSAEKVYKDLQRMKRLHPNPPTLLPKNTKASPGTSAVKNKKPLASKSSIGQSTKPDLSVAGSSTHSVYEEEAALMNIDSSLEYPAYTWDSVPAYKLPQDSLEMYLRGKFGDFRFYILVRRFGLSRKEQMLYKANNGDQSSSSRRVISDSGLPES